MKCENCGNEVREGAKFCSKCGSNILEQQEDHSGKHNVHETKTEKKVCELWEMYLEKSQNFALNVGAVQWNKKRM